MYMYVKLSTKRIKVLLLISAVCNTYFFFFFFWKQNNVKKLTCDLCISVSSFTGMLYYVPCIGTYSQTIQYAV